MINKTYYCNICDKYVLNKSSHNKSKIHKHLSLGVFNKDRISNVPVIEIDDVINKHIYDYNTRFVNYICWCKIQNEYFSDNYRVIWHTSPKAIKIKEKIIKRHNCQQNDLVNIEIVFISDLDCVTFNHYLQLPKRVLERKICQIIDRNPNLIKTLYAMPEPFKNHIIMKYWGFQQNGYDYLPRNWMNLEART